MTRERYRNIDWTARNLHYLLDAIPPEAAPALVEFLHALAAEVKELGQRNEDRQAVKKDAARNQKRLQQLPLLVAEAMANGATLTQAIQATADATDTPTATVAQRWRKHVQYSRQALAATRAEDAAEMYREGRSDEEIAAALAISKRHVSRLIRRKREQKDSRMGWKNTPRTNRPPKNKS